MSDENATPHDASEPEAPNQWCVKCEKQVTPTRPTGQCPSCGRPLRGSSLAAKYRVNKARVKELLDTFVLDYQPTTQRLMSMCQQYADVTAHLEVMRVGTPERARLAEESLRLGKELEAHRELTQDERVEKDGLGDLSLGELISTSTATLHRLLELRDAEAEPEGSPEGSPASGQGVTTGPAENSVPTAGQPPPGPASDLGSGLPSAYCSYCRRQPCVGSEDVAFETLHWNSPSEVDRRAKRYMTEMTESLRRQRSGGFPTW